MVCFIVSLLGGWFGGFFSVVRSASVGLGSFPQLFLALTLLLSCPECVVSLDVSPFPASITAIDVL